MIILGVDPGIANCGYAVVEKHKIGKHTIKKSGVIKTSAEESDGTRLVAIEDEFYELNYKYPFDVVAIEEIFYGKFAKAASSTTKVIAMTEIFCVDVFKPIIHVNPHEVKSFLLPDVKKPSKEQVVTAVNEKFNTLIVHHHEADALAIALVGAWKHSVNSG